MKNTTSQFIKILQNVIDARRSIHYQSQSTPGMKKMLIIASLNHTHYRAQE